MADELKFKIGAVDDTKKAFESAKKRAGEMLEKYKDLAKAGLTPSGEHKSLKKMENQFKKIVDQMKNAGKESQKMFRRPSGTAGRGAGLEGQISGAEALTTGREDVFLASKIGDLGKALKASSNTFKENMQSSSKEMEKIKSGAKDLGGIFKRIGIGGGGAGTGAGIGGRTPIDVTNEQASALQEAGKTLPAVGIALAAVAGLYKVMSAMSNAFRQRAGAQMTGIQTLGYAGGGKGGFYEGDPLLGIQGAEKVNLMAAYARQTMGRTGEQFGPAGSRVDKMMRAMATYGLSAGQVGGYAGTFDRFRKQEEIKNNTMMMSLGAAEEVGMGGARTVEFLDNVKSALSDAVYSGTKRSNKDIITSLMAFSSNSDERIKALAPQIMSASTTLFGRAAMMEGGAAESFAMQSVWNKMKREKQGPVSFFDVQKQMVRNPLYGTKSMVEEAEKLFPGNKDLAALWLQKSGAFGRVQDVDVMKSIMESVKTFDASKSGKMTPEALAAKGEGVVESRLEKLTGAIELTKAQDVRDSNIALIGVNETMVKTTQELKTSIQNLIKSLDRYREMTPKQQVQADLTNPINQWRMIFSPTYRSSLKKKLTGNRAQ